MSNFTWEDEWSEIQRYNALVDEQDRRNRALTVRKNKLKMQDTLRQQILEQKQFKQKQMEKDKIYEKKAKEQVQKELQKQEKQKLMMKQKQNGKNHAHFLHNLTNFVENREMIENQMKLFQMQKRMQAEEKKRYEKQLVTELKQKIEEEKENKLRNRRDQYQVYERIRKGKFLNNLAKIQI